MLCSVQSSQQLSNQAQCNISQQIQDIGSQKLKDSDRYSQKYFKNVKMIYYPVSKSINLNNQSPNQSENSDDQNKRYENILSKGKNQPSQVISDQSYQFDCLADISFQQNQYNQDRQNENSSPKIIKSKSTTNINSRQKQNVSNTDNLIQTLQQKIKNITQKFKIQNPIINQQTNPIDNQKKQQQPISDQQNKNNNLTLTLNSNINIEQNRQEQTSQVSSQHAGKSYICNYERNRYLNPSQKEQQQQINSYCNKNYYYQITQKSFRKFFKQFLSQTSTNRSPYIISQNLKQTLQKLKSLINLKYPFNADRYQKQIKIASASIHGKQVPMKSLKNKNYQKSDLYRPTLEQLRTFIKNYEKQIKNNIKRIMKQINQAKNQIQRLKRQIQIKKKQRQKLKSKQEEIEVSFKNLQIKDLQGQLSDQQDLLKSLKEKKTQLLESYSKTLKPSISKINQQLNKYLFEEFYQNFTTVQVQLYEFFQFNSNILIQNKQFKNTQKSIRPPREYFKLIRKQLKSKQNKKTPYRQQSNKYNLDRFQNDNIQIKNWQKMKRYFQNPTQEYQKKFKFLISPILNRNVYCWNKVYKKLEKKFYLDQKIQPLKQTSVIQLPVNMYSLSYVVMICLEITEKKQLLSQIEDLAQLSQKIVENIFERPKDKELKMEKQLKDQIKYNEFFTKQDILLSQKRVKKRKIYELELEAWMLLVKFVEELIKKIIKIEYRQDYTRRKVAEKFLIDFIETFYLYNYVVSIYQNQYGKMLDFKYFISLINRLDKKESQQKSSCMETKLNVFWQSFFYIQIVEQNQKYQIAYLQQKINLHYRSNVLKFVYLRCVSQELGSQSQQRIKKINQVKQMNQIKQLKLKLQTKKLSQPKYFNFWLFYNDIYPLKSQNDMIELETKYMVHFSQYCQQIIAELSEAKNISLDVVFNCIRFLQINLMLHFTNLCFDQIQRSIQKQCGRLHKRKFIQYRNKNDKWIDCMNKSQKAIKLAFEKILTYINSMTKPQQLRKSANVQKIKKMIQEQQELMSIFLALNMDTKTVRSIERVEHITGQQDKTNMKIRNIFNQNVDRDQQLFKYLKKNYNEYNLSKRYENVKTIRQFQQVANRPKYLYRFIIEQLGKEYFSTKIMEKTFKKLLKTNLGEQAAKTYDFKKYSKNLKFIYVQQEKNHKKISQFKQKFQKFQKQWVISIIQTIKLSSLVVTLPFYSFETQRENERIRYGRIFNNDLRRKQPKKLLQIMKTLDLFYIYKADRLNTNYMQRKQCNFDEILQIKLKYLKYTKRISQFFQQLRQSAYSAYSTQFEPVNNFRYIQQLQLHQPTQIQSIPYQESLTAIYSLQDCPFLQLNVQPILKKIKEQQKRNKMKKQKPTYQILNNQTLDQFYVKVFRKQISHSIFKLIFQKGVQFLDKKANKDKQLQENEITSIYLKLFKRSICSVNSYIFKQKTQIPANILQRKIDYQRIFKFGVKQIYQEIIKAGNCQQYKFQEKVQFIYQKSFSTQEGSIGSQTQSDKQDQKKYQQEQKDQLTNFKQFIQDIKSIQKSQKLKITQQNQSFTFSQKENQYTGNGSSYMSLGSIFKRKDELSITRHRIFQKSSTIDTVVYAQHTTREIGKQNFLIFNQSISLSLYNIIKLYLYQNQQFQCNIRLSWLQRYNQILPQQIDQLQGIKQGLNQSGSSQQPSPRRPK